MSSGALPDDPETLKAMPVAERVQNEWLRQIIRELQPHRFGRRAETLSEDQMLLGLEDVEQAEADHAAETDDASPLGAAGPSSQASDEPGNAAGTSAAD